MTYYCDNCNNIIRQWENNYNFYNSIDYCFYIESKKNKFVYFLNCKKCNKFVGISCYYVCKNCFGKDIIIGEKNLFNWFQQYKKFKLKYINFKYSCKICNNDDFRCQYWFFKELTFYKL